MPLHYSTLLNILNNIYIANLYFPYTINIPLLYGRSGRFILYSFFFSCLISLASLSRRTETKV